MCRNNWEEASLQIIFPHPFSSNHFSSDKTILLYSIPLPFNLFLFPTYIYVQVKSLVLYIDSIRSWIRFIKWSMQVLWLGASLFEGSLLPYDIQLVHQMGRQDMLFIPSITGTMEKSLVGPWKRVFLLVALSLWNIIPPEIWLAPNLFLFWKALMTWFCPWAGGQEWRLSWSSIDLILLLLPLMVKERYGAFMLWIFNIVIHLESPSLNWVTI